MRKHYLYGICVGVIRLIMNCGVIQSRSCGFVKSGVRNNYNYSDIVDKFSR